MRPIPIVLAAATALSLLASSAAAAGKCVTKIDQLCDTVDGSEADAIFGDYADVGVLAAGFVLLILLLTVVLRLFGAGAARANVKATPREEILQVAPGGTVQLLIDVENTSPKVATDVLLLLPPLPEGWTAETFASTVYGSGFTQPQVLSAERSVHLSSPERGSHQATLAVQVVAPSDGPSEETLDVPVRVVPVVGGVPRTDRAQLIKFSVLLATHRPALQITNVSHEPAAITAGHPVVTRAVLANEADAEARDVGVQFLLNDQTVDHKNVPRLGAHAETTVEFQWTPGHGENRIRISVA